MKKKTLILIILSFPITLTVYVFLFTDNIKFEEEIVINANIDTIALILNNPSKIDNYMPGVETYSLKKGNLGKKGAVAEIKINSEGNDIVLKETIIYNNLPNEIKISYKADEVYNIVTHRLEVLSNNKIRLTNIQEFEFNGYMKFVSFFMESALKNQTRVYLDNFKKYIETGKPLENEK
tara:strand:- start:185 stop:721 length:537 start_codon:yes stop_codon:yes gene_type:complete